MKNRIVSTFIYLFVIALIYILHKIEYAQIYKKGEFDERISV